jgi:hypothetical protein
MAYAVKNANGDWEEITGPFVAFGVGPMLYETEEDEEGIFRSVKELGPDNLSYPPGWLDSATAEERNAAGVKEIIDIDDYPTNVRVIGTALVDHLGTPRKTYITQQFDVEAARAFKRAELENYWAGLQRDGFQLQHGGASYALQTRDSDVPNWQLLESVCHQEINGDQPCPLPIRTTDNANITLTVDGTMALVHRIYAYRANCLMALWAKKDAINNAVNAQQVLAVDTRSGWPS